MICDFYLSLLANKHLHFDILNKYYLFIYSRSSDIWWIFKLNETDFAAVVFIFRNCK